MSFPNLIEQSSGHIAKKLKLSFSMSQKTADCSQPSLISSVVSRISQYPPAKSSGFPREPHAPVRNRKFGRSSSDRVTEATPRDSDRDRDSQVDAMGRFSGFYRLYENAKRSALKTFRYVVPEQGIKKEVIEIDSDDENRGDVCDDSSVEELKLENLRSVGNFNGGKQGSVENSGGRKVRKDELSLDSSVVTDVSNAIAKVDGGEKGRLSVLDQEPDDFGVPMYKRLLKDSEKSDSKLSNLGLDIELEEKRLQFYRLSTPRKKEVPLKKVGLCYSYGNFPTLCSSFFVVDHFTHIFLLRYDVWVEFMCRMLSMNVLWLLLKRIRD